MPERRRSRERFPEPTSAGGGRAPWSEAWVADGVPRVHWAEMLELVASRNAGGRESVSQAANRLLEDIGVTFNAFSDVVGTGRPHRIDPVPLLVPQGEWREVEAGMAQRVELLEEVLNDIYGAQTLLRDGLLPPDLPHALPWFQPGLCGIAAAAGARLVTLGCDLVRTPDGRWRVWRDHASSPAGLGHALQNRLVMSQLLPDAIREGAIAALRPFLEAERRRLLEIAGKGREQTNVNVVMLTPGFRHPSFFDHAYNARLLGFPLVEAADLTVRERRLHLKTLSGLRPIHGVVRRVDDEALDPLEFWSADGSGVAGLVEAWRCGNVALANAPGSGFVGSPALLPFLPGICRAWRGEELRLPFVETWWLGQPEILARVLERPTALDSYVLLSATADEPELPVRGTSLSARARRQWIERIRARPHAFVLQRDVEISRAPSLGGRRPQEASLSWRCFALRERDGARVLPGGLARVGKPGSNPWFWPAHDGLTKDVWVNQETHRPAESDAAAEALTPPPSSGLPAAAEIPSRIAEQMFWVGRYAERLELAVRLLRVTLRRSTSGEGGPEGGGRCEACILLARGSRMFGSAFDAMPEEDITAVVGSLVFGGPASGGLLHSLVQPLIVNAAATRDRLSDDTWRFFNRLEGLIRPDSRRSPGAMLTRTLDSLVLHLAAFAGMQAESMTRGQGWRFLEIGRRLERAMGVSGLLSTAATARGAAVLDALLETCDSGMTYRRRHFSRPRRSAVLDLLARDVSNPRSVAYQVAVLSSESTRLPDADRSGGRSAAIRERLETLSKYLQDEPSPANWTTGLANELEGVADQITQHFFTHSLRRVF